MEKALTKLPFVRSAGFDSDRFAVGARFARVGIDSYSGA